MFNDIVQVGVIVKDVDACVDKYRELLGLRDWHINYFDTKTGKGRKFHKDGKPIDAKLKVAWINIGNVELELIEPQDEESHYAEFLREEGPGIHHLLFATTDYDKCAATMVENNIDVVCSGEYQHTRFQMFDTKKDLGLICEIAKGGALTPDESL
jgi:4-hydroxyphenylpyruvate dioxygenase-like putative hemolysin